MTLKIKCPTCEKPSVWSTDNQWRPFCSERCKLIDLGSWADESYTIPTESSNQTDEVYPYLPDENDVS